MGQASTGGLVVFACGPGNYLTHKWQNSVGGTWSDWASLGGSITDTPVVAVASTGGNVVFARGTGGDPQPNYHVTGGPGFRPLRSLPTTLFALRAITCSIPAQLPKLVP